MEKKGWQGADLVFDIDADHIPTKCNKIHDEWTCGNKQCGFSGKGITPESCRICGGEKFETKTWPCDLCLDSAKEETEKLVDMLGNDLDSMGRKEIVDYVSGIGLSLIERGKKEQSKQNRASQEFTLNDYGWNRRLKNGMRKLILGASKEDLKNIGIKSKAELILRSKEAVLKRCLEENRWDCVKGVSVETWTKLAEHVRDLESAKIDTVVTTDVHRLIRANGTLHGKTGLLKAKVPVSRLRSFDPFKEAVAFKEGEAEIFVSDAPEFRLGGETFGPYKNQKVRLSTAAAVLLICKGRAEVLK